MNDYLFSVIQGIVEGLTEFLPISSTAHLRIVQALFHVDPHDGFWKMYTIVIQLGAVLCLPVYFRARIAKFLSTFPRGERGDRNLFTHPVSLTMIAFVVTAGPAYLLSKRIGKNLESLYVMGAALVVGGVIMWLVDTIYGRRESRARTLRVEDMSLAQAIWIGAVQILSAVFPGTSRSMCTIAAGQVSGMTRAAALEFSFFLSLPTMAAATLYDFYKTVIKHKGEDGATLPPVEMTTQRWIILAIGFVVSFLVAIVVVHWFMGWVRKRGFTPFAIYRVIVGIAVLIWASSRAHV